MMMTEVDQWVAVVIQALVVIKVNIFDPNKQKMFYSMLVFWFITKIIISEKGLVHSLSDTQIRSDEICMLSNDDDE